MTKTITRKQLRRIIKEEIQHIIENTTVTTTVDKFFTWYMATAEWAKDLQTTNTMSVDNKHAQDVGDKGKAWLLFLQRNKNKPINITISAIDHGFDNTFSIGKHTIAVDSSDKFAASK
jgi:hypothetical protein